ncbi:hypothetical protein WA577_006783 [Blastocystis sp. JDR]
MQTREAVETVSQQQSLAVVKNMVRTSISEICYLRNLFNEDCFSQKNYAGIMINALHPVTNGKEGDQPQIHNQEAWQLTRWLEEGVFDALEKRYLRGLVFAIYDHPEDKQKSRLLETYSYAFTYPDTTNITLEVTQNNDKSVVTTDGVKNQAVILLRTLITLCSTLNPLPNERWVTMQLYYYDDVTPPDYQPKYFEDTATASITPGSSTFVADPFVIETGKLRTPYHAMCMKVRVTEMVKDESTSGETHEEQLDQGLVTLMRWIVEHNRIDVDSITHDLSMKESEVRSELKKLRSPPMTA